MGGAESLLITPKELSACLATVFSFTIFQIMTPLIAFAGTLGHQYFPFLLPSVPPTHLSSPAPNCFVWIWWRSGFYPFGVLSGWIKSQLALDNHSGSALGTRETVYLRLSYPPGLTWCGIYSYTESGITRTSEIPHSPELRYYGTFVKQPIVSAPNWFMLASVEQGGRGRGGDPRPRLDSWVSWGHCRFS